MLPDTPASRRYPASTPSRTARRARAPRRAAPDGSRVRGSFLGLQMLGGFFVHALPDFGGHRVARLLEDVADQADRSRHHAEPAHDLPVEAELAGECTDRARGIERELLLLGNLFHQLAVLAVVPGLARDLEEPRRARVDRLVQRVAEAGDAFVLGDDLLRVLADRFGEQPRRAFGR